MLYLFLFDNYVRLDCCQLLLMNVHLDNSIIFMVVDCNFFKAFPFCGVEFFTWLLFPGVL